MSVTNEEVRIIDDLLNIAGEAWAVVDGFKGMPVTLDQLNNFGDLIRNLQVKTERLDRLPPESQGMLLGGVGRARWGLRRLFLTPFRHWVTTIRPIIGDCPHWKSRVFNLSEAERNTRNAWLLLARASWTSYAAGAGIPASEFSLEEFHQ